MICSNGLTIRSSTGLSFTNGNCSSNGILLSSHHIERMRNMGVKEINFDRPDDIRSLLKGEPLPPRPEVKVNNAEDLIHAVEKDPTSVVELIHKHIPGMRQKMDKSLIVQLMQACSSDSYKFDCIQALIKHPTCLDGSVCTVASLICILGTISSDSYKCDVVEMFAPILKETTIGECISKSISSDSYRVDALKHLDDKLVCSLADLPRLLSCISSDSYRVDAIEVVTKEYDSSTHHDVNKHVKSILQRIQSHSYRYDALKLLIRLGETIDMEILDCFDSSYRKDAEKALNHQKSKKRKKRKRSASPEIDVQRRPVPPVVPVHALHGDYKTPPQTKEIEEEQLRWAIEASLLDSTSKDRLLELESKLELQQTVIASLEEQSKQDHIPKGFQRLPKSKALVPFEYKCALAAGEETACNVCEENRTNAFLSCGHVCLCLKCAIATAENHGVCPLCRTNITEIRVAVL